MPLLGLGTYRMRGATCTTAVETALRAGYRLLDTAQVYGNEADVGAGLRASGVAREAVFLVTKLEPKAQGEGAYDACRASLDRLGVAYVDLLLIHWPGAQGHKPTDPLLPGLRAASWRGLQRMVAEGVGNATPGARGTGQSLTSCHRSICPATASPGYWRVELYGSAFRGA